MAGAPSLGAAHRPGIWVLARDPPGWPPIGPCLFLFLFLGRAELQSYRCCTEGALIGQRNKHTGLGTSLSKHPIPRGKIYGLA